MNKFSFDEILLFFEGKLPQSRAEEFRQQLKVSQDFQDIIGGLEIIKKELNPNEDLREFLKQKSIDLGKKFFS